MKLSILGSVIIDELQLISFAMKTHILLLYLVSYTSCNSNLKAQPQSHYEELVHKSEIKSDTTIIKREIDPNYKYPYEKTKYVPPEGKTLLIMGQSVERVKEYMNHFKDKPHPAGWAAYWGIPEFKGVDKAHKNETGSTQNHQMLVDDFPNSVIQSALWMVGKWEVAKNVYLGRYDNVIRSYSRWAKSSNRPIYLRIGYEFDGPHNELEPEDYKKAYQYIVKMMRDEGVVNVAYVWHSYAAKTYKTYPLSSWYPGDDYVDWVGISVFGHAYGGKDFGRECDEVLTFAKAHKKPVMIAESNPIHGIDASDSTVWEKWFVHYFNFIYSKNIKAVSFINEDWPSLHIPGISHWKDGRLYNNPDIAEAWFKETGNDRFLKASPDLFRILGFK